MNSGWVKLHRKLLDNEYLANDNTACLLFVKLLLTVNRDGKLITGRFKLSLLINEKPITVYKALKRLEKWGIIELFSNNKGTTILICNFTEYQQVSNNKVTTKEQQSNNKVTLYKKEERRKKNNIYTELKNSGDKNNSKLESQFNELCGALDLSSRTKFLPERRRKLIERLKHFEHLDILKAAQNLATDDFMMGRDEKNTKRYATIDYLLRNNTIIDRWLNVDESSETSIHDLDLSKLEFGG